MHETDLLYTCFSIRTAVYLNEEGEIEHGFGGFVIGIDVEEKHVVSREEHYMADFQ